MSPLHHKPGGIGMEFLVVFFAVFFILACVVGPIVGPDDRTGFKRPDRKAHMFVGSWFADR
jgi:hypothetical protein